jgi:hypothetical protein
LRIVSRRGTRVVTVLCSMLLMAALAAPAASARPGSSAAIRCENVSGTFLGQAVPWADGTGFDVFNMGLTGPLEGHPIGAQTNYIEIVKALPNGGIHFEGAHDFYTDAFGQMETHDKGHITANGSGHNVMTLVGDHSGQIIIQADVDLATGAIDATYHGRVCTQ